MRIGVLTTSYPRFAGDSAGHFVAEINRWLVGSGVAVDVICAAADNPLFYRGGAILELASARGVLSAARFSAQMFVAARAQRRNWDAVISHWLAPCGVIADQLGLPHLAVAHGSDIALLRRLPFGEKLVRRIAARADLVYVADALRVHDAPGRVVPMGVDLSSVQGGARAPSKTPTALFIGRLIHDKGCDRAIAALPSGWRLIVAGEGPERESLERGAFPHAVQFVGHVEGQAKRDLFASADVLIVPSRVDGAPTVIAEAVAVGLPIVACPVGGIKDFVAPRLILATPDELGSALRNAYALGRGAPAAPGAWPDQNAQAAATCLPFLRQFAAKFSPQRSVDCCEAVTLRI